MGPKRHTLYNLNQMRLLSWDHFPVITGIEGRELKTTKCVKGWAGWTPGSEAEKRSSKNLCSVYEVNLVRPPYVMPRMVRDWSFYMAGWWAKLQRLKLPQLREGTRPNFVYLQKSGRWHPTQLSAGTMDRI